MGKSYLINTCRVLPNYWENNFYYQQSKYGPPCSLHAFSSKKYSRLAKVAKKDSKSKRPSFFPDFPTDPERGIFSIYQVQVETVVIRPHETNWTSRKIPKVLLHKFQGLRVEVNACGVAPDLRDKSFGSPVPNSSNSLQPLILL